jgi:CrcB protein
MNLILIAVGGAFGAVLRSLSYHFITQLIRGSVFAHIPFATLFVNVLGSFLIGVFYYFSIKYFDNFDERLRQFFVFGFLGSFTTFSAFSLDFFRLFNAGQLGLAFTYAVLSFVLAILAVFLGFYLMKII